MTTHSFIHLRLHSEFSITDGITRIDEAIKKAKQYQMPALALTDINNLFGMVKFYQTAHRHGLKPIIGTDIWLENSLDRNKPFRLLLLAKNHQGYLFLCDLLTRAYLNNQYRGRAEIKKAWLDHSQSQHLIALSGAMQGDIGQALLNGHPDEAAALAQGWSTLFPTSFYLELQRTQDTQSHIYTNLALDLAEQCHLPLIATHPIQFLAAEDFKAHEARTCISGGFMLADKRRPHEFTEDQYFLSTDEMLTRFQDIPEALQNTVEVAKRCNVIVELGKSFLPQIATPAGQSVEDYFVESAQLGLAQRIEQMYPDPALQAKKMPLYSERLQFETKTIIQMNFPGYFLIVADFINWAKKNGVPVGPGRGSGAGSLVAFSLGITDIDPLQYALLFERFLNPERISMPDFDIDFCQDNRGRVIEYVRSKYGADAVSQIVTFGTMAAKAVVRDVGRVLDLPYSFVDGLSKLIPSAPGKQYSLDDALQMEPLLKERVQNEEEVSELFILAKKLEGLTRNVGMHAGGVLIAPGKLTDFCPLYQGYGEDTNPVSQFDKDDVELIGLVKFDFLGLRNLTIIDLALRYITLLDANFDRRLDYIHFDDPATYGVLKKANTTAVFQLESEGMKKLLEKLQPDRFEDIIAVLALYRPGPLGSGMVDDFILRKKGQQPIDYFHDKLKACLEPTYGVIVYQEQVMQISQIIGGYTLGAADMLRRAMGKKKPEEMAKHRSIFVEGALKGGYTQALAEKLFDLMAMFAEYGFNKSHTAAYAVVSYHTAWLKAHHTAAFMAATMSLELDNTDQLRVFYEDSLANGLRILPPDINCSCYRFIPVSRQDIRYALGALKGSGEAAINFIVEEREKNGPYQSLFEFCMRIDKRTVNKRTIEALIRAGAFDTLTSHRASLLASLPLALEAAEQASTHAAQQSLFGEIDEPINMLQLVEVAPWNDVTRLQEEKLAVGFYLSGHLFHAHASKIRPFLKTRLKDLRPHKEVQWLVGVVNTIRVKNGERGRMGFLELDDGETRVEVAVFNELFDLHRPKLKEDNLLVIEAKVSEDRYSGGRRIVAENVYDFAEARSRFARSLTLHLNDTTDIKTLQQLLQAGPRGICPIKITYQTSHAQCILQLSLEWAITLQDELLAAFKSHFGTEAIHIEY
jgi:DNA polymerase-3 subunit alpha